MNQLQFRHRRTIASSGTLGAMMLMADCASLPPKVGLSTPRPAGGYDMSVSLAAPSRRWPDDHWWSSYGDAQFGTLIEEALAGAPDLKVAMAKIRRSDAITSQAGASLLPGIDANASVRETRQSYNLGTRTVRCRRFGAGDRSWSRARRCAAVNRPGFAGTDRRPAARDGRARLRGTAA